jgi:hypothetical protein
VYAVVQWFYIGNLFKAFRLNTVRFNESCEDSVLEVSVVVLNGLGVVIKFAVSQVVSD